MIGTMLVKINDNDAKEDKVMEALNKGNITSIILVGISSYLLTIYMLPETMRMNFFGEGTIEVSSMSVFYNTCWSNCRWCYFFCYRILYWIR